METAALWLARLDSGTADPSEFERWRDADPSHGAAFARVAATLQQVGSAKTHHPGLRLAAASRVTGGGNRRRQIIAGFAAAGALSLAAAWPVVASRSERTAVGARKTVTLSDGLRMELNTDSRVSWRLEDEMWRLQLAQGEIALSITEGARPCLLSGGAVKVIVTGGDLNVFLRGQSLDVTAVSGRSTLRFPGKASAPDSAPFFIEDGQAALIGGKDVHMRTLTEGDKHFITGWRRGELVLDGQTLGVVVDEYNRYLTKKIVIADPQLSALRLGGRFTTRDPQEFLKAVGASFGIRAIKEDSGVIVLMR